MPSTIVVRYNHYREEVPVVESEGESDTLGKIKASELTELFSLDFAFNGSFVVHLNE